jgi:hypothetical protein
MATPLSTQAEIHGLGEEPPARGAGWNEVTSQGLEPQLGSWLIAQPHPEGSR